MRFVRDLLFSKYLFVFAGLVEHCHGFVHCLVELQFVFTFACVVVVSLYDFARQLAADFLTVAVEVVVEVVLQHLFQFVELRFHRVGHITLRFGSLAKERNASLAQLVVLELVGVDKLLEIVENFVGDFMWL